MTKISRSSISRAHRGKGLWKALWKDSSVPHSLQETGILCSDVSTNRTAKYEYFRKLAPFLLRPGSPTSCLPHLVSSSRGYATAAVLNSSSSSNVARSLGIVSLIAGSGLATYYLYPRLVDKSTPEIPDVHTMANWSNTHEVQTSVYLQPESLEELEQAVRNAHEKKQKLRAVGSGLSPNGIGFCNEGMVNLALMDEIVEVDKESGKVTVQAGARVEQLVAALRPYGLTLQNYASIKEQQVGGLIQVGAHGTGAMLAPLDDNVVGLKLVTPAKGTLHLTPESDPDLFYFARCGLGALGVVAEVTFQCVPRHRLLEYTFVTNMKGVQKNHKKWLQENKHIRYLWIPDTDAVVVVHCNPFPEGKEAPKMKEIVQDEKLQHVRALYKESVAKYRAPNLSESSSQVIDLTSVNGKEGKGLAMEQKGDEARFLSDAELNDRTFFELRDILVALDPLNREHIIRVNKAEAEFWKRSEGYRTGWSDELLGFDCGGQQWVSEVTFPVGTIKKPDLKDIKYMEEVLQLIKKESIPAPAPIEQRWSARSRSPLSPAYSTSPDTLFSWVGVIMYLPTDDVEQREAITKSFFAYRKALQNKLWDQYNAHEHWAKIEVPTDEDSLHWVQERIKNHFSVEVFNRLRSELDPNQIMTNYHVEQLFPL